MDKRFLIAFSGLIAIVGGGIMFSLGGLVAAAHVEQDKRAAACGGLTTVAVRTNSGGPLDLCVNTKTGAVTVPIAKR
jgi:hypothetical protein